MDFSEKLVSDYQIDADNTLARVCRWVAALMLSIGILNLLGVFVINGSYMYPVLSAGNRRYIYNLQLFYKGFAMVSG